MIVVTDSSNPQKMQVRKLITTLANENQNKCFTIPLFKSFDLGDLIGGYDQKRMVDSVLDIQHQVTSFLISHYLQLSSSPQLQKFFKIFIQLREYIKSQKEGTIKVLQQMQNLIKNSEELSKENEFLLQSENAFIFNFFKNLLLKIESILFSPIIFKWIDSALIEALEKGYWIIFENCEQIHPALLEKLNGLLEEEGEIELSECLSEDSENVRTIKKHSNFKAFLIFNCSPNQSPQISKPLLNRCAYIHFDKLFDQLFLKCFPETKEISGCPIDQLEIYNQNINNIKNELKHLFQFTPTFYELIRDHVKEKKINEKDDSEPIDLENIVGVFCFDMKRLLEKMIQFECCFNQYKTSKMLLSIVFQSEIDKIKSFISSLCPYFFDSFLSKYSTRSFEFKFFIDHFLNQSYPSSLISKDNDNIEKLISLSQKMLTSSDLGSPETFNKFKFIALTIFNENEDALKATNSIFNINFNSCDKEDLKNFIVKVLTLAYACKSNYNALISCFQKEIRQANSFYKNSIEEENQISKIQTSKNQNLLTFLKQVFLMKLSNPFSIKKLIQSSNENPTLTFLNDPLLVQKINFLSQNQKRKAKDFILFELSTLLDQLFKSNVEEKGESWTESVWVSFRTIVTGDSHVSLNSILPKKMKKEKENISKKNVDFETRLEVFSQVLLDVNKKYEDRLRKLDERVYQIKDENNVLCDSFLLCTPDLEASFLYLLANKKLIFERESRVDGRIHSFKINNSVLEDYDSFSVVVDNIFESINRLKTKWESIKSLEKKESGTSFYLKDVADIPPKMQSILSITNLRKSLFGKYLEFSKKEMLFKAIHFLEKIKFDQKKILEHGIYKKLFCVLISEIENLYELSLPPTASSDNSDRNFGIINHVFFKNYLQNSYLNDHKIFYFFESLSNKNLLHILENVSSRFENKSKQIKKIWISLQNFMEIELELRTKNISQSIFNINWLIDTNGVNLIKKQIIKYPEFSELICKFISEIEKLKKIINEVRLDCINLSCFIDSHSKENSISFTQKLIESLGLLVGNYKITSQRMKTIQLLVEFVKDSESPLHRINALLISFLQESLENYEMIIFEEEIVLLSWLVLQKQVRISPTFEFDQYYTFEDIQNLNFYTQFVTNTLCDDGQKQKAGLSTSTLNATITETIKLISEHCVSLSLSLETSENKRLSKTRTEEGKLKMLKSKVNELSTYEYEKTDRTKRKFRRDMELSQMFKTHLQDFEDEESGISYNYIQRVAQMNQTEVNEEMYSREKGLKRALKEIRKNEFEEREEAQESSRLLLKEYNAVSSLLVKSIGLDILLRKSEKKGNLGIWKESKSGTQVAEFILKEYCGIDKISRFSLIQNDKKSIFKSYFQSRIDNFDEQETNCQRQSAFLRMSQNDSNLKTLFLLNPFELEFSVCPSLSLLLNFYSSNLSPMAIKSELTFSKPSILELDMMTRLSCFQLVKDQKKLELFDFYVDQVDHKTMGEFVGLLDELMDWVEQLEEQLVEMAGMPVFVSLKNLVLKIVKFGSNCPYR